MHPGALDDLVDGVARAVHSQPDQVELVARYGADGGTVVPVIAGREEIRGEHRDWQIAASARVCAAVSTSRVASKTSTGCRNSGR